MKKIIEICCGSYYDAMQAFKGGVKRIELNSSLYMGGLTPSLASLKLTKKNTDLKVICMVRPRGAGFHYNEEDFEIMLEDCRILMENGADGIAFGCLEEDHTIDEEKTKRMIDIIKSNHGEVVFHRAFDCVKDPYKSIETLISLGVDRVLTSGLKAKAIDGKDLIKQLQDQYGKQIQILVGSGINALNAKEMMDYTGVYQVHSSCKDWINDSTTSSEYVTYSYAPQPNSENYDVVSEELVRKIVNSIE